MAVVIVGPLSMTRDGASGKVVRYAMLAVALVPDFNAVAEEEVAEDQHDEAAPTLKENPEDEEEQDIMDPVHDYDFGAELQKCQAVMPGPVYC